MSGRVTFDSSSGERPAGVEIERSRLLVRPVDAAFGGRPLTITVAADGTFTSGQVGPGPQSVTFSPVPQGWALKSMTAGGRDVLGRTFDLDASATDLQVVLTDKVGELSGSVTGMTPDQTTAVLLVPVDPRAPGEFAVHRLRQVTARGGSYRFTGVIAGEYVVVALAPAAVGPDAADEQTVRALAPQGTRVTIAGGDKKTISLAPAIKK
jgi:hypothetical protein